MSRPIDADALIERLQNLAYNDWNQGITISFADACGEIIEVIGEQPTIEPERNTGHWIRTGRDNVYGGFEVECSECGDTVMIMHIEDELYCRHCGAKMGEGEK